MLGLSTLFLPDAQAPRGTLSPRAPSSPIHGGGGQVEFADWPKILLDLPVRTYELCDRVPRDQLLPLGHAIRSQGRSIVGLRNYCPRPADLRRGQRARNVLSLTHLDRSQRSLAVAATCETLEWAARLEAGVVTVEAGTTGMASPQPKIDKLQKEGRWSGPEGSRARELFARSRQQHAAPAFEALLSSLDRILGMADDLEVSVALINPGGYDEMPSALEFRRLIAEFKGSPLHTWYDVAHARRQELMGFESAYELRQSMMDRPVEPDASADVPSTGCRIVGYHLRDWRGHDDELPPGEGEIDFKVALEDASPDAPMIIDCRTGTPPERIAQSLEHLRALGLEGPPSTPWEDHLPRIGG